MANIPRSGFGDFVGPIGFNEPMNPFMMPNWDPTPSTGVGDFVPIQGFNEPMNPITGMAGCACGSRRRGMGAVAVPTWAATLPAPLNGVDPVLGVPWVYWGLGVGAAVIVVPMLGKKGRR